MNDVRTGKLAGLNVTIPHKLAAFRAMDRLTPAAERTGAVNTVIRDGPRLLGDNTDPYGFIEALRQFGGFDPAGAAVVVLWAPAAPPAPPSSPSSTAAPAASSSPTAPKPAPTNSSKGHRIRPTTRRIHACGLDDNQPITKDRFRRPTPRQHHQRRHVRRPRSRRQPRAPPTHSTPTSSSTTSSTAPPSPPCWPPPRQCGAPTLGGLEMLVMQGAASLQQWTGRPAPARTMLTAARSCAKHRPTRRNHPHPMANLRYLTAGESHGPGLTVIVEGLPLGVPLGVQDINPDLSRRQGGYGRGGRMKIERDQAVIRSGIRLGETLGSPITLLIENRDWANWGEKMAIEAPAATTCRPSPNPAPATPTSPA